MFWGRRFIGRRLFLRGLIWRRFLFGSFIILAIGGVAYKMHQDDVRRIEQQTGKKAEDLSEAELVDSMKKLEVKRIDLTEDEAKSIKESYIE